MTVEGDRASAIFVALSRVPPEARPRFLDEHCGSDAILRREVERLLDGVDDGDPLVSPLDATAPFGDAGISRSPASRVDRQPAAADSVSDAGRRQIRRHRLALALTVAGLTLVTALGVYVVRQRTRIAAVNAQLEDQLTTAAIEQGKLLSVGGDPAAEESVWRQLLRHPDSDYARWALWDIYSREPSLWTHLEHENGTQTVRFSSDSRLLLTAGRLDGEIHLLDADTGQLMRRFVAEPRSGLVRALFANAGTTVVSGSVDGTIRVWDVGSGRMRREFPKVFPGLREIVLAGDADRVVAVAGGTLHVLSLATGRPVDGVSGLVERASIVAVQPRGAFAVAGSDDGSLTGIDLDTRSRVWRVQAHQSEVTSIAVSPNAQLIVSGSVDGAVRMSRPSDGAALRRIAAENGTVRNLSFDAGGTMLAVAGQWRTRVWNVGDPSAAPRDIGGAEGMTDVHLRPDGAAMATSNGTSGQVRMWHLAADSRLAHWPNHRGPVTGLVLIEAAHLVVTGGSDGGVMSRSPDQAPGSSASFAAGGTVNAIDLSPDTRWLATAGAPDAAGVWDLHAGQRVGRFTGARDLRAVTFADGGRRIVAGESDGTVRMYEWVDGRTGDVAIIPSTDTQVLAVASRGNRVFVAHGNHAIVVRDVATGQEIRRFATSSAPFSLALTPDGRLLAAGTYLGTVELWDIESGQKRGELKGERSVVTAIDISPGGTRLAAASRDGATRLWNVSGQSLATIAVRKPGATRVRFFPDGRRVAIGYEDGEVEIRDLEYFFRHAAGQTEYQLQLLTKAGESFPRSAEAVAWARSLLPRH